MKFTRLPLLILALLTVFASVYNSAFAGPPDLPRFRQDWLIPSTIPNVSMHTEILAPRGRGPFPLAVINHGSTAEADERKGLLLTNFDRIASWFIAHGYLVAVPQRPGHGDTGGAYLEDIGSCENPDYVSAGLGAAASMDATVRYLTGQPFVRKTGVVLVGHSAGAWGALAVASQRPEALRAVVNFSGGLGGHSYGEPNRNCAPDHLVKAAATFGQSARVPTLWLYAANDTYFNPALSKQMADAYRGSGGIAEYHLLPPVGEDGHFLMFLRDGMPLWAPVLEKFLGGRTN